jgi:hypothetical protein
MKEVEINIGFKGKCKLFLIMLPIEWRLRKVNGFKLFQLIYDVFIRKHKALLG